MSNCGKLGTICRYLGAYSLRGNLNEAVYSAVGSTRRVPQEAYIVVGKTR